MFPGMVVVLEVGSLQLGRTKLLMCCQWYFPSQMNELNFNHEVLKVDKVLPDGKTSDENWDGPAGGLAGELNEKQGAI